MERHLGHFRNAGGNLHGENVHMLSHLRRIADGQLKPVAQDLNFYSHELRESVRFRAAGITSSTQPAFQSVYRNSHYATLREYGFSFDVQEYAGQLYTPQAISFQGR